MFQKSNAGLAGRIFGFLDVGGGLDLDPCQSVDFGPDLVVYTRTGNSDLRGSLESSGDGGAVAAGPGTYPCIDPIGTGTACRGMYCGSCDSGSRHERTSSRSVIPR